MYSSKETGWKAAARLCILPGLPMYLVQELYAGTVLLLEACGSLKLLPLVRCRVGGGGGGGGGVGVTIPT